MIDYLRKFDKVSSTKVIYGVFSEGPLRGIRNGDRSYKVEIKPKTNLGSYHVIDGQKVTIRFPGQQQTCARCHKTPAHCRGRGVARQCEAEGGVKVEFVDYILDLWKEIGYSPENTDFEDIHDDTETDLAANQQEGGVFTPVKTASPNTGKITGISVKQFPKETDHGEILEFLVKCGLPEGKRDCVTINSRGTASIRNLDNSECLVLIEAIHGKRNFDKKLFCNGIVPLTPEKVEEDNVEQSDVDSTPASEQPEKAPSVSQPVGDTPSLDSSANVKPLPPPVPVITNTQPSGSGYFGVTGSSLTPYQMFERDRFPQDAELVRRHSLSIIDRSPPPHSLAAEILCSRRLSSTIKTNIMASIADIQESLSDFNSCVESSGEGSVSSDDDCDTLKVDKKGEPKSLNDRKREKKLKRKLVLTPSKEDFFKKPNRHTSPI